MSRDRGRTGRQSIFFRLSRFLPPKDRQGPRNEPQALARFEQWRHMTQSPTLHLDSEWGVGFGPRLTLAVPRSFPDQINKARSASKSCSPPLNSSGLLLSNYDFKNWLIHSNGLAYFWEKSRSRDDTWTHVTGSKITPTVIRDHRLVYTTWNLPDVWLNRLNFLSDQVLAARWIRMPSNNSSLWHSQSLSPRLRWNVGLSIRNSRCR